MIRVLTCFLVLLFPAMAMAQLLSNEDVQSVKQRGMMDFDQPGIGMRSFLLFPALRLEGEYDDNIFADPANEQSDFIVKIKPELQLKSNWEIHELRAYAKGEKGEYIDNDAENYEDYDTGVSGRYDIGYDTFLSASARYQQKHEERGSPDDVGGAEPTKFSIAETTLGFTRALAKLKLNLFGTYRDVEFENVRAAGGSVIDNSFRNRVQTQLGMRWAYEIIPNYEAFIEAIYDNRDYDKAGVPDRSSDGYELNLGTALNITGKVKGEVYGGYMSRDYGSSFEDIDTVDYGASLLWNVDGLTSVIGSVDRAVNETTGTGVSGYVRTNTTAEIQHAFLKNLLALAGASYINDDFVGGPREDDSGRVFFDLEYRPSRAIESGLHYEYIERDSNIDTLDYSSNRFMVRMGYKL